MIPPSVRRPPQFSMQSLMIAVTAAAVISAILSWIGSWLGMRLQPVVIGFWKLTAAVGLGTLAVYCRGHYRTFFGAAFVGLLMGLYLTFQLGVSVAPFQLIAVILLPALGAALAGGVALFTRRFLERRGWHLPEKKAEPRDPTLRP